MFKKKNKNQKASVKDGTQQVGTQLPAQPGQQLHHYRPLDYTIMPGIEESLFHALDEAVQPIIDTADTETPGEVCQSIVSGQINLTHKALDTEQASHQRAIEGIQNAKSTRKNYLLRSIEARKASIQNMAEQISTMNSKPARYGWAGIPLLITLAFVAIDLVTQYNFLKVIYTDGRVMLWLMAILVAAFSDLPMYGAAKLLSIPEENVSKGMRMVGIVLFFTIFLADSACTMCIRIGSMADTFATHATRETIYVESYTLAQWSATLVSAIAPFITGVICFFMTLDQNELVARTRKKLVKAMRVQEKSLEEDMQELDLLENAPDLVAHDLRNCALAHQYLDALHPTLDMHVMKALTAKMNDPKYTDKMQAAEDRVMARLEENPNTEGQMVLVPLQEKADA